MTRRPFETGDVVWSPDPYHADDPALADAPPARPWLVISTSRYPRQGEDYVCCALTSNLREDPGPGPSGAARLDPRRAG